MLKATITTATSVDAKLMAKLKAGVTKKYPKEQLSFEFVTDPAVLGGMKVVVGAKSVDLTLQSKLAQVKEQLLAKL